METLEEVANPATTIQSLTEVIYMYLLLLPLGGMLLVYKAWGDKLATYERLKNT